MVCLRILATQIKQWKEVSWIFNKSGERINMFQVDIFQKKPEYLKLKAAYFII